MKSKAIMFNSHDRIFISINRENFNRRTKSINIRLSVITLEWLFQFVSLKIDPNVANDIDRCGQWEWGVLFPKDDKKN